MKQNGDGVAKEGESRVELQILYDKVRSYTPFGGVHPLPIMFVFCKSSQAHLYRTRREHKNESKQKS
jgi:hypothetical protein